jgi:hypothetical protein
MPGVISIDGMFPRVYVIILTYMYLYFHQRVRFSLLELDI